MTRRGKNKAKQQQKKATDKQIGKQKQKQKKPDELQVISFSTSFLQAKCN